MNRDVIARYYMNSFLPTRAQYKYFRLPSFFSMTRKGLNGEGALPFVGTALGGNLAFRSRFGVSDVE
jgi:hypothetical protein